MKIEYFISRILLWRKNWKWLKQNLILMRITFSTVIIYLFTCACLQNWCYGSSTKLDISNGWSNSWRAGFPWSLGQCELLLKYDFINQSLLPPMCGVLRFVHTQCKVYIYIYLTSAALSIVRIYPESRLECLTLSTVMIELKLRTFSSLSYTWNNLWGEGDWFLQKFQDIFEFCIGKIYYVKYSCLNLLF